MIFSDVKSFIHKWLFHQNTNLLVSIHYFNITEYLYKEYPIKIIEKPCYYTIHKNIYTLDMNHKHYSYDTISGIMNSIINSNIDSQKKIIIIKHIDISCDKIKKYLKSIIDNSYKTCLFLCFFTNYNKIDSCLCTRFIHIRKLDIQQDQEIPSYIAPIDKSISKVLTIYKQPLHVDKFIKMIKELSYKYNSIYTDITPFQNLLCQTICNNIKLPNPIKFKIINDISMINTLYNNSYKKYLYLEYTIISIYSSIEDYIDFL